MDSMKINKETLEAKRQFYTRELEEQLAPQKSNGPSIFKIALGVVLGLFMAWFISALIGIGVLAAASKAISEKVNTATRKPQSQPAQIYQSRPAPKITTPQLRQQSKSIEELSREHLKKQQTLNKARAAAMKTCQFWIKQAEKEKTELNRLYRDQACKRVAQIK